MGEKLFLLNKLRELIDAEILAASNGAGESKNSAQNTTESTAGDPDVRFELRVIGNNKSIFWMELGGVPQQVDVAPDDQGRANAFFETFGSDLLQSTFKQGEPSSAYDPLDEAESRGIRSIDGTYKPESSHGLPTDSEGLRFFNF